ncbi:MAG: Rrf2 family transcriptional regulator [Planctomycetes bacterium]|nr:Rrf2 family transcriptional regulator [Planctomycetota bacterium]
MLRLTRRSEYGLMALAYLASRPREYCSVREIVEELKLPKRLLAEVLKDLSRAGTVEATRGPGGGYRLVRSAEELPLARVVEILEGPVAMTDCMAQTCELEASCIIQTGIGRVTSSIRNVLEDMTVAELLPASSEAPLAV